MSRDVKVVRKERRKELDDLLDMPVDELNVTRAIAIIDQIRSEVTDKKKFNYEGDQGLRDPLVKAACLGHVVIVDYLLSLGKDMPKLAVDGGEPVILSVAQEIQRLFLNTPARYRDVALLNHLQQVLSLLLKQQEAIDSMTKMNYSGQSFLIEFMRIIATQETIFSAQDVAALHVLDTMTAKGAPSNFMIPTRSVMRDFLSRHTCPIPSSAGTSATASWLGYLYYTVAKQDFFRINADFLKTLVQVGYVPTLSDSSVINKMISQNQMGLCVALLEGAVLRGDKDALSNIRAFFEEARVVDTMLTYCVDHYVKRYEAKDNNSWELHVPIIHFLIVLKQATEELKFIRDNNPRLFQILKDLGASSTNAICVSFKKMVDRIKQDKSGSGKSLVDELGFDLDFGGSEEIYKTYAEITNPEHFLGKLGDRIAKNMPGKPGTLLTKGRTNVSSSSYETPIQTPFSYGRSDSSQVSASPLSPVSTAEVGKSSSAGPERSSAEIEEAAVMGNVIMSITGRLPPHSKKPAPLPKPDPSYVPPEYAEANQGIPARTNSGSPQNVSVEGALPPALPPKDTKPSLKQEELYGKLGTYMQMQMPPTKPKPDVKPKSAALFAPSPQSVEVTKTAVDKGLKKPSEVKATADTSQAATRAFSS